MSWIRKILTWIGGLTVLLVSLLVYAAATVEDSLPERMVVEIDLRAGMTEYTGDHPLALVKGDRPSLVEVTQALRRAANDERVIGLFGRLGAARMSLAHIQELQSAITDFRASGKPVIAFAETMGGLLPANGAYALATSFGDVRLQPSGGIGLVGLSVEHPFLRGTLDSLGIIPAFGQREAYKLAPNLFTETGFTDVHREATESLLKDQMAQLVSAIASERGVDPERVRTWIDEGPHNAQSAFAKGLVDDLAYLNEVKAAFRHDGGGAEFTDIGEYLDSETGDGGAKVALIYGVGTIVSGKSKYDAVGENQSAGSDTIVDALVAASEDPDVRAVLFRVDSPGGSYVASDAIWHATREVQAKGIPVVVSMGAAAATGGYLVSTHADRIVAEPGTITGSIGVWAGKFVTPAFWQKLGVSWDSVSYGPQAELGSSLSNFSAEERRHFDGQLDRIYDAFSKQVADGRELSDDQLIAAAGGRVWTGRQALEHGLVDSLGGVEVALASIRELLDLDTRAELSLVVFPKPKDLVERILEGDWEDLSTSTLPEVGLLRRVQRLSEVAREPAAWAPWLDVLRH